jgi:hypothetical protein
VGHAVAQEPVTPVVRLALVTAAITGTVVAVRIRGARTRAKRGVRAAGVVGYLGLWGSGKTLAMTRDLILAMRAGQIVYATYHIRDPLTGQHAHYIDPDADDFVDQIARIQAPPDSEDEIAAEAERSAWVERSRLRRWLRRHVGMYAPRKRVPKVVVGFDEINVIFPSRMWSAMPVKMLYAWAQGGKRGIAVRWTAQTEKRVDTVAREVSHEVARTYVFVRLFGRPMLLRQAYYLPEDVGASAEARKEKRLRSRWVFVSWWVLEGYDTLEQVKPSAHLEKLKDGATRGRRAA